jgi:hypothetical protein
VIHEQRRNQMSEDLPLGQNLASGKRVVAAGLCSAIAFRLKTFGHARGTDHANSGGPPRIQYCDSGCFQTLAT